MMSATTVTGTPGQQRSVAVCVRVGPPGQPVSLCGPGGSVAAVHVVGDDVPFIIFTAQSLTHAREVRTGNDPRAERTGRAAPADQTSADNERR